MSRYSLAFECVTWFWNKFECWSHLALLTYVAQPAILIIFSSGKLFVISEVLHVLPYFYLILYKHLKRLHQLHSRRCYLYIWAATSITFTSNSWDSCSSDIIRPRANTFLMSLMPHSLKTLRYVVAYLCIIWVYHLLKFTTSYYSCKNRY